MDEFRSFADFVASGELALLPDRALEADWAGRGFTRRNEESSS
jgi:hypothetical protein